MLILVLESSTTSAKAMLYCSENKVIETLTESYPLEYTKDGEQNATGIFEHTARLGKKLAEGKKIDAISLGGAWHSILVCDENKSPVTPVYTWEYLGASATSQKLRKNSHFTKEYYSETGCMVHSIYPYFKLLHLKENGLDLQNKYFFTQGSYNFYKLTDEYITTESMASGSGLLNVHTKKYYDKALAYLGLSENQFERLVKRDTIGKLTKYGSELLRIATGTPVIPCNPDGALNQVGAGAGESDSGIMTLSVGTSAALRQSVNRPLIPENPSTWCYISPFSWLSGGAVSGACNCVDWAKEVFFDKNISYKEIEFAQVDFLSMPHFLPFLFGERCPGWNDGRNAEFKEVKNYHLKTDMYFSVLEGVLFNIKQCYEMLCITNGKPKSIELSGGILHSKVWKQMCADIFGCELICSQEKQTSLVGGALMAMYAMGINIKNQVENISVEKIIPDYKNVDVFKVRYQKYLNFYNR